MADRYIVVDPNTATSAGGRYVVLPPKESAPELPGFFSTLATELGGGVKQLGRGLAAPFTTDIKSDLGALADIPLGALRTVGALGTATGARAGKTVYEGVPALGIPGTESPVAAGAADAIANVASSYGTAPLYRAITRRLPGASQAFREGGREVVEALPGKMAPATPAEKLYTVVAKANPSVELPRLKAAADELAKNEELLGAFGLAESKLSNVADETAAAVMQATTTKVPTGILNAGGEEIAKIEKTLAQKKVPFSTIQQVRSRLGELIGASRRTGGPELGAYKKLYRALSDDLENAADKGTTETFRALKEANKAARREFATGELDEIIQTSIRARDGQPLPNVSFSAIANKFKDKLRKDELFRGSFTPEEITSIRKTLEDFGNLPVMGAPRGQAVGSSLAFGRLGAGYGLGKAIGTDPAMTAVVVERAGQLLSRALMTSGGRKMVYALAKSPGGLISPASMQLLQGYDAVVNEGGALFTPEPGRKYPVVSE